jgi:hypothetical protein
VTLSNCYVTLDDLQRRLGVTGTSSDSLLEQAITSACRTIDDWCGQFFYDAGSATARTFRADDPWLLHTVPFHTTTGLVVKTDTGDDAGYATTWTSADYELDYPDLAGAPYDTVRAVGDYVFLPNNRRRRSVQVTARWGWAAVPQAVEEATLILSTDLYKRKDAAFGIATGGVDFGGLRIGRDVMAQVASLLARFRREHVFGLG